jgi:hypothetical protein
MSHESAQEIEFQKRVNGRVVSRFKVSEEVSAVVEELLSKKGYEHEHHGNCRAVVIFGEINEEVYAQRVARHGAKPIEEHWFPSALAASRHFGYQHNAVVQALGHAKQRGEEVALVGGVPVRWANDLPGVD